MRSRVLMTAVVLASCLTCGVATAGPLYFSAGNSTTWDLATVNWGTVTGAYNTSAWASGSDANFEGTAGVVNVATAAAIDGVNSMTFGVTGYTIAGGTLNMVGSGSLTATATATTGTISSILTGTGGINKYGSGKVFLSSAGQMYTGTTRVNAGTLSLTGTGDAANGIFADAASRTLEVSSGAVNGMLYCSGEWSLGTKNKLVLNSIKSVVQAAQADSHLYINDLTSSGGKIAGTTGSTLGFRVGKDSDAVFTTTATGTTTDISANIYMEKTASADEFILNVQDTNPAAYDMLIMGNIADLSPETAGMTLVKRGVGALILRDASTSGTGIKTFTGKTIVEEGWVRLGTSSTNGMLTGDLEVQSGAEVIIASGNKTAGSGRTISYAGDITGTGAIIQEYGGTVTYSGNHNYADDTYIDGLYINTGSFTFDVNNAGDSSKFLQFLGSTGNGIVESTYNYFGGTASFDGVINLDVTGLTDTTGSWTLVDTTPNELPGLNGLYGLTGLYNMTGINLVDDGSTIASFSGSGADWSCANGSKEWTFSGGVLNLATVPEPGTLAMLSAALLGLIAYAWRRRR